MNRIDLSNYAAILAAHRRPYQANYFAMYSSLLDGVTVDPALMQLPIDDHLVHRGDGVFDACKCADGAIYNLDAHLARLERSAAAIGIRWPAGRADIRRLVVATAAVAGRPDAAIRVFLARGPGSFGVNPFDAPEPALYIVAHAQGAPFMDAHPAGATVRRSTVPVKPGGMAEIKNCNYLPNVLMKREAVEWGVDFVVGYDGAGHMTEGATENMGIVTRAGELLFPRLENILAGTTMLRAIELAAELTRSGELRAVGFRDLTEDDVRAAAELLIVGTTINVAAARAYEGRPVGDGRPGPVWRRLSALLDADIHSNAALRTEFLPPAAARTAARP